MIRTFIIAGLMVATVPASLSARPAAHHTHAARTQTATPVILRPQPGTALDAAARTLVARDIGSEDGNARSALLLVGSATLSTQSNARPALFVQVQSARQCGSAGCSTLVYVWQGGAYQRVLDGVDGKMAVSTRHTKGMADLMSDADRYVWDGTAYRDVSAVPASVQRPTRRR